MAVFITEATSPRSLHSEALAPEYVNLQKKEKVPVRISSAGRGHACWISEGEKELVMKMQIAVSIAQTSFYIKNCNTPAPIVNTLVQSFV